MSEEEEVAHQRALAEMVLRHPVIPVMKAMFEGELQACIDRGVGNSRRARQLRGLIRACEEEAAQ